MEILIIAAIFLILLCLLSSNEDLLQALINGFVFATGAMIGCTAFLFVFISGMVATIYLLTVFL